MGGYGSGSRQRYAPRSDEFRKIDFSLFKLKSHSDVIKGQMTWSRCGRQIASVGYELSQFEFRLYYELTKNGQKLIVDERMRLDFTAQPFGGKRRWFLCKSCGARCRVLYGGARFRCRKCHKATYESQYEGWCVPGRSKAERTRKALGAEYGLSDDFPEKPAGMHWRTYLRLKKQDQRVASVMHRLLSEMRE